MIKLELYPFTDAHWSARNYNFYIDCQNFIKEQGITDRELENEDIDRDMAWYNDKTDYQKVMRRLLVVAWYWSACKWYINFSKKLYRELDQIEKDFIFRKN